jgi:hypothetical protein
VDTFRVLGLPQPRRERQQRRIDAYCIEKRKGRKIKVSGRAYGGYPCNWPWRHGIEHDAIKLAVRKV